MTPEDLKLMVEKLTASGKYTVLKRHEAPERYAPEDGAEKLIGIVLDTECTGLGYKTVRCQSRSLAHSGQDRGIREAADAEPDRSQDSAAESHGNRA